MFPFFANNVAEPIPEDTIAPDITPPCPSVNESPTFEDQNDSKDVVPKHFRPSTDPLNTSHPDDPPLETPKSPDQEPYVEIEAEIKKESFLEGFPTFDFFDWLDFMWDTLEFREQYKKRKASNLEFFTGVCREFAENIMSAMIDFCDGLLTRPEFRFNSFSFSVKNRAAFDFLSEIKKPEYGSWNLGAFEASDVNTSLLDVLPSQITETMLPLNIDTGSLNFYESFCLGYMGFRNGGELFRRALVHRVLTTPEEFQALCDIFNEDKHCVLSNLKQPCEPSKVEIAMLSRMVQKNITVIKFDESGSVVESLYYDCSPSESMGTKTVYLGQYLTADTSVFFPLIRKKYREGNPPEATTSAIQSSYISSFKEPESFILEEFSPKISIFELDERLDISFNSSLRNVNTNYYMDGLINAGNTCFINSTVQSMLALPFANIENLEGLLKDCHELLNHMRGNPKLQSRAYNAILGKLFANTKFSFGDQGDAHELICSILEGFEGRMLKPFFEFEMKKTYTCFSEHCSEYNHVLETMKEIFKPANMTLSNAVNEILSSSEEISAICSKCGADIMNVTESFVTTPACLMIVSKSYRENGMKFFEQDRNFEEEITLSSQTGIGTYRLSSVITHIGNNVNSGHFRCFVKKDEYWVCYDDSLVTVINSPSLLTQETLYVQFYVRSKFF